MPLDFATVRERARGQWGWLLPSLGVAAEFLRNRHGPCPGCGGKDRFRYDDREGAGTWVCGGGGEVAAGDGFALLLHVRGGDVREVFGQVAAVLGLDQGQEATPEERARWRAEREAAERRERDRECGLALLQEVELLAAVLRRRYLGDEPGAVTSAAPEVDQRARAIWGQSGTSGASEYLRRKQVLAHGVRFRAPGLMVVPARDLGGRLVSLQFIAQDGAKTFLGGASQIGLMHFIGDAVTARPVAAREVHGWTRTDPEPPALVCIGEGYATVAAVHELMDWPGVVAFTGGNLATVARCVRFRWPGAFLVILGDWDQKHGQAPGEPGLSAALGAAEACGGVAVFPAIEDGQSWDWNDVMVRRGAQEMGETLRAALAGAKAGYADRVREAARRARVLLADQFGLAGRP